MTDIAELLDSDKDVAAFESLRKTICLGDMLALVGSGISARLGYPTWDQLLSDMAAEGARHAMGIAERTDGLQRRPAAQPTGEPISREDVLWYAEELRTQLEGRYFQFLQKAFSPRPEDSKDACIELLVRLPFRQLLTTNYDDALERAYSRVHGHAIPTTNWANEDDVKHVMYELLTPTAPRRLVYLHGRIDDATSLVLTDRDYARRYLQSDSTARKLFAIFAMRRIVFFGFSLADPDLSFIMRHVAAALGYDGSCRHFAFVGFEPRTPREMDRRRFKRKFGIEPIFYDASNNHERLEALIAHLVNTCGADPLSELASEEHPESRAAAPVSGRPSSPPQVSVPTPSAAPAPPAPAAFSAPNRGQDTTATQRHSSHITSDDLVLNPDVPDDPRKGMFGGLATSSGRTLSAIVRAIPGSREWFEVRLDVAGNDDAPRLTSAVTFYLHPTFRPDVIEAEPEDGHAEVVLTSYGAFTVGAVTDDGMTMLELCLANLADAPKEFRDR
jgi:hypothetical protein